MKSYRAGAAAKRRWPKLMLFLAITVVLAGVAAFFGLKALYEQGLKPIDPSADTEITFVVQSGDTPARIAQGLSDKQLIRSTRSFTQYVKISGLEEKIKAGTYSLKQSQSVQEIVQILTEGRVAANLFTIIPGYNLANIKADFIKKGFTEAEVEQAFNPAQYTGHPALVDKPEGASLEGFLFPDSYEFLPGTTRPETVIKLALDEMASALTPEIRAGMAAQGLSVYQGIILASIVEREVGAVDKDGLPTDNRAKAAQVFLKRLQIGMMLQSNATDNYPPEYDTYAIAGLPPGPISNVSLSSLTAVTNPSDTDYLYFVAGRDCVTRFSQTNEQHEALKTQHGVARPEDQCRG